MPQFIPFTPSDNNYRLVVPLNGSVYLFDVRWNSRADIDPVTKAERGAWFFDLYEQDETLIAGGIKVTLGVPLGRRSAKQFFRDNILTAIDTTGKGQDAGFDDLGARVVVQHITVAELGG